MFHKWLIKQTKMCNMVDGVIWLIVRRECVDMFKGTPGIKVSVESVSLSLYTLILSSEGEKILSLESEASIENCVHQSANV